MTTPTPDPTHQLQLTKFDARTFVGQTIHLAGGAFIVHDRGDRRDYDHSHAGIERKRIDAAVEIRTREIDAELQLRTAALDAQLRMLEMQNTGSEPHRRPQLSDRGQR